MLSDAIIHRRAEVAPPAPPATPAPQGEGQPDWRFIVERRIVAGRAASDWFEYRRLATRDLAETVVETQKELADGFEYRVRPQ
jgi:hypothetical protein